MCLLSLQARGRGKRLQIGPEFVSQLHHTLQVILQERIRLFILSLDFIICKIEDYPLIGAVVKKVKVVKKPYTGFVCVSNCKETFILIF